MKILHIDWEAFLGFMESWRGLAAGARLLLLDAKPKGVLPRNALGDELAPLVEGGFLKSMKGSMLPQLSGSFHESHKVLRALTRHPLLEHHDARRLREYLGEHFTNDERQGLNDSGFHGWDDTMVLCATVASAGHVRGFLGATDRRAWEKQRLPRNTWSGERAWTQARPLLAGKNAADDLVRLLEVLAAADEPIPFHALAERTGTPSRVRLAKAIEAGLRYLFVFPVLDPERVPGLTLWPGVARRLRRVPAPPPERVTPEESLCVAFRMEDLTQLLVRAAEPMRVKAGGAELFVTVERELERGLMPLPAWLTSPPLFPENAPGARVREALRLARSLGFVDESDARGRERALLATPAGWEWLDTSPRERLRALLDPLRPEPERAPPEEAEELAGVAAPRARKGHDLFGDDEVLDELDEIDALDEFEEEFEDELVPFRREPSYRSATLSDGLLFGASAEKGLMRTALETYAALEPGQAVSFHAFLQHHAEASNPFLRPERRTGRGFRGYGPPATEEELEELWIQGLRRLLHHALLPLGGVRVGLAHPGGLTIELTSVGRYLLGLTSAFTLDTPAPAKTPVRVQPDFEVVFVAASPALEAAISRFAERRGTGVGVLFRITRESILQAAQSGLAADEVLATLAGACTTPVPANVAHEIRAWFAACRRLSIEPAHLVRCPDAATAARVLAAAGAGKLEALSETVLALTDPTHKAAVVRACRKAGLFLASTFEAPEPRTRPKRRQRRWR